MSTPRRALILIDVQREYFSGPLEIRHPSPSDALASITTAIDAATEADLPIAVIQHDGGAESPVFDPGDPAFELHPEIEQRRAGHWKSVVKRYGSVFADTDLHGWLTEQGVDTVTFVGFMTNNCVLASSVDTERLGLEAEVLSDATGAISIANEAGAAPAHTVHTTLMALLNSNWAAVAPTADWVTALTEGSALPASNLVSSAVDGADRTAVA